MQPRDFYVRQEAEEGRRVELSNVDGTPSGHWMVVRSVLSRPYAATFEEIKARAFDEVVCISKAQGGGAAARMHKEQQHTRKARLVASLIAAWSFDLPCTETEKTKLLIHEH